MMKVGVGGQGVPPAITRSLEVEANTGNNNSSSSSSSSRDPSRQEGSQQPVRRLLSSASECEARLSANEQADQQPDPSLPPPS
ncbi:hypothetical protein Pmani_004413 [Petrolisthes manimaculis]|uniref:Uncharacterized protein n=1 Tax=Petrolisthes manimaculis TaxID=1843537 RepID=A0AAE1QEX4_9EUCA|nr:hypothetical protein Pmani_004413 [Petrolisthes manimaculis]